MIVLSESSSGKGDKPRTFEMTLLINLVLALNWIEFRKKFIFLLFEP